jgi:hypothetical protein
MATPACGPCGEDAVGLLAAVRGQQADGARHLPSA